MDGRGWGNYAWDLLLVLGWVCLTWLVVLVPGIRTSVLRLIVVLPMVLGGMGYVVVAAVFPPGLEGESSSGQPDPIEWLILSVAVSVAVGILLGSVLALSPLGLTPVTSLLGVTAVTLGGIGVALSRRPIPWADLIFSDRLGTQADRQMEDDGSSLPGLSHRDITGTVVVALVVLAAIGGGGGMLALAAHDPPGYTEFAVLPERGATNVTAADYDASLTDGSGAVLVVGNHHEKERTYVVEVTVQRATRGDDGVVVEDRQPVGELTLTVGPGSNATRTRAVDLPWPGETRRVVYRLFRVDGGERTVVARTHVWLNASDVQ